LTTGGLITLCDEAVRFCGVHVSLLIVNGRVITPERDLRADILVEGETIAAIGPHLPSAGHRVIDAAGKYVIPGAIDVHTHLDAPVGNAVSSDDFESGTRAAAFGGTTCIIDFATQRRGGSLRKALEEWRQKAARSTLDYGLHMVVTDLEAAPLAGMDEIVQEGVTSFKIFLAYPGTLMIGDAAVYRVLRKAGSLGALVCVHAENGGLIEALIQDALAAGERAPVFHARTRPPVAEAEATHRAIALARAAQAPVYIVHVTCREAVDEIARAREKDEPVFAETCPQYLLLSEDDLRRPGFEGAKFVLTPPLRPAEHQDALWHALDQGLLQVVSTDHCPFLFHGQKDANVRDFTTIPNGGPGIEHRVELLFHHGVTGGRLSLRRWVELVSTVPARIFGLAPRKGVIDVGGDADLVVWDPAAEHTISAQTHHMRVDYSMYEGMTVRGKASTVIARGAVLVDDDGWHGTQGAGRFIKRKTHAGPFEEMTGC
jgi:dihydropyrimidinase